MFLAGFLAGLINYQQSPLSLEFLVINPVVPTLYIFAARLARKRLNPDLRLHSMRDVLTLLLFSLGVSFVAAFTGTAVLYYSGKVPSLDYLTAAFNWWIGDAVALSSVSTFLLEFVLPHLRRFLGMPEIFPTHLSTGPRHHRRLEVLAFLAALFVSLTLVFGWTSNHSAQSLLSSLPSHYLDCCPPRFARGHRGHALVERQPGRDYANAPSKIGRIRAPPTPHVHPGSYGPDAGSCHRRTSRSSALLRTKRGKSSAHSGIGRGRYFRYRFSQRLHFY